MIPWKLPSLTLLAAICHATLASGGVEAPAQVAPVAKFHREVLATIPVGRAPSDFSDGVCGEGGGGCEAGILLLGSDGTTYIYDYGHQNLKVIRLTTAGPATVSVLSGPEIEYRNANPIVGAVADDGTIALLSDTRRLRDRYRLHILRRDARDWESTAWFDDKRLGMDRESGMHPVGNAVRLRVQSADSVSLYHTRGLSSEGELLCYMGSRLLPEEARPLLHPRLGLLRAGPSGVTNVGGRATARDSAERIRPFEVGMARYLGSDAQDRLYFVAIRPEPTVVLECYSPQGRLLASAERPTHRAESGRPPRHIAMESDLPLVLPDGRVIDVEITATTLSLVAWTFD